MAHITHKELEALRLSVARTLEGLFTQQPPLSHDQILAELEAAYTWRDAKQAFEVFIAHARNRGMSEVNLTETGTVNFGDVIRLSSRKPAWAVDDTSLVITQPQLLDVHFDPATERIAQDAGYPAGVIPPFIPPSPPTYGIGGEALTPEEARAQAFTGFLSMQPFAQTPALMGAAEKLRDPISRQFFLQSPVRSQEADDTGLSAFREFLGTGQRWTGDLLKKGFGDLASALFGGEAAIAAERGAPGYAGEAGLFDKPALQNRLWQTFGTAPKAAFGTFGMQPGLDPWMRPFAQDALKRAQDRYFYQNPGASAADVARYFGYTPQS